MPLGIFLDDLIVFIVQETKRRENGARGAEEVGEVGREGGREAGRKKGKKQVIEGGREGGMEGWKDGRMEGGEGGEGGTDIELIQIHTSPETAFVRFWTE